MTMHEQVQIYKEDLELLGDKDSKMEYILDYGKEAIKLNPDEKNDDNIIKGCASLAWLQKDFINGKIMLKAEGDSIIAKGMLVMLLAIFNNRTPDEILTFDSNELLQMGVMELLSPVRQQGMQAFLNVIYGYTNACKKRQL